MMIENALRNGKNSVIEKPHLTMQAGEKKNAEMNKAAKGKDDKAAVFAQSRKEDYNEKKLSPLQKSILDLRERIFKIKEDESMKQEEKDKLLQDMNKQLKLMEDQLAEEIKRELTEGKEEADSTNSAKQEEEEGGKSMNKQQPQEKKLAETLIGAGASLERMDSLDEMAGKNKGRAKAAQRELDYAVNHPCPGNPEQSSLRLHDKIIINKKQGEINGMNGTAEKLQAEMGKAARKQNEDMERVNEDGARLDEEENEKKVEKDETSFFL